MMGILGRVSKQYWLPAVGEADGLGIDKQVIWFAMALHDHSPCFHSNPTFQLPPCYTYTSGWHLHLVIALSWGPGLSFSSLLIHGYL